MDTKVESRWRKLDRGEGMLVKGYRIEVKRELGGKTGMMPCNMFQVSPIKYEDLALSPCDSTHKKYENGKTKNLSGASNLGLVTGSPVHAPSHNLTLTTTLNIMPSKRTHKSMA